ncbi:MAG: hypothetical protein ACRDRC_07155 [Pseudonocardiaceae bacterium]
MIPGSSIPTGVGLAQVLHRLALAVECVDGFTGQLSHIAVRAGREVPGRLLSVRFDPSWPLLDLDGTGVAQFRLRHRPDLPNTVTVRLAEAARRFVPRRLVIPLWTLVEVAAADLGTAGAVPVPVPVRSRLVRCWLLPGSAYSLPRGVTGIRGRVVRAGVPVRWPRVTAFEAGIPVGWAHGDERGEFLLPIVDSAILPPPAKLDLQLAVTAPDPAHPTPVDPDDRYADLVAEDVARSAAPPLPADLDNDLLRGRTTPAGYVRSAAPPPQLAVRPGELVTARDIAFTV